jgi:hypothetical protein
MPIDEIAATATGRGAILAEEICHKLATGRKRVPRTMADFCGFRSATFDSKRASIGPLLAVIPM